MKSSLVGVAQLQYVIWIRFPQMSTSNADVTGTPELHVCVRHEAHDVCAEALRRNG